ncbi:MAG: carotenoid oxygenase family protein [Limnoraphis sp.]
MKRSNFSRRDFLKAAAFASFLSTVGGHSLLALSAPSRKLISTQEWLSDNIFLQGINAPVFKELDLENLKVTGEIPADLNGMYMRNGPNPYLKPANYQYPLEGDGMIHAVYLKEGKASYRNRWIVTKTLQQDMEGKERQNMPLVNFANTNIVPYGDNLLALYEVGLPYQISSELETLGEWDFDGELEEAMTAHPKVDPHTGELHFYRYSLLAAPYLVYYVADKQGKIIRKTPIEMESPALIHDTAITENYIIFFHCPLVFNVFQALGGGLPFEWKPEYGTKIGLIHRKNVDQKPIWIETEPLWMWHFMNAYEQEGEVVVDFAYHNQIKLDPATVNSGKEVKSHLQRLIINPEEKTAKHEPLDDRVVDFPTFDFRKTGQSYRFGYTPHIDVELVAQKQIPNYFSELIQYDLERKVSHVHRFKPGRYCGEASFIPKQGQEAEDQGYVVTFVFDENTATSSLVILDPANFASEPLAEIHLPVRVPSGFHGNWISSII